MALILIDTNLLIYLYDQNSPEKQKRSRFVLDQLQARGAGRVSVQSLSEFANTAIRKLSPIMTATDVVDQIEMFSHVWPILYVTPTMVADAVRGVRDHQLSFMTRKYGLALVSIKYQLCLVKTFKMDRF